MNKCVNAYTHTNNTHAKRHACAHILTHTYTRMQTHAQAYTHTYTLLHIRTQSLTYMYTNTCMIQHERNSTYKHCQL